MADKKVTELSAITNLSGDDLLLVVNDPNGTPTSNKVTVSNLFANVVPNVVHKGTVTNTGNTTFTGTTMTVTANLIVGGTSILDAINDRIQVANVDIETINLRINDRMQVANTRVLISNERANTELLVNDRMQVANTRALISNERANTELLVNDRMQVANVATSIDNRLANLQDVTIANTINANTFIANGETSTSALKIRTKSDDVSSSNAVSANVASGLVFYSNTYLYVTTDSNTIKRLHFESDFTSIENRLIDLGTLP